MAVDNRTPEEIIADLEARRNTHVFMTTEEAQAWNDARAKTPLSKNHWSVKAGKVTHVLRMGGAWKKLAKTLYTDMLIVRGKVAEIQSVMRELETENTKLRRMMEYCDKCHAGPGDDCAFNCSRDGLRDQ